MTENIDAEYIVFALAKFSHSGLSFIENSAILIGKDRRGGLRRWINQIYISKKRTGNEYFIKRYPFASRFGYADFLVHVNGCDLFESKLFIFGVRYFSTKADELYLPWDIFDHNDERFETICSLGSILIGGSHLTSGGISYVENRDGSVVAFDGEDFSTPIYRWENFGVFIKREIIRLNKITNDSGELIDRAKSLNYSMT